MTSKCSQFQAVIRMPISMVNQMVMSEIREFVQNQIIRAFRRGKLFDFGQGASEIIIIL